MNNPRKLDQFYTSKKVVEICIKEIKQNIIYYQN